MEIKNKYKLGDEVFFPGADLRSSRIFKGEVEGIVVQREDGEEIIAYQVGQPYAVREEDLFSEQKPAIDRLVEILDEKKEEIAGDIDDAIVKIQESKPEDITFDLTAEYEQPESEVGGPVVVPAEQPETTE